MKKNDFDKKKDLIACLYAINSEMLLQTKN